MKLEANKLLNVFENENSKNFTIEIRKATPSVAFNKEVKKKFNRADLWNIQRRRKNTFVRRYY